MPSGNNLFLVPNNFPKWYTPLTYPSSSLMGNPAQAKNVSGTYEARTSPFSVTVTGKRKKENPYRWVSPKGVGNMTVMPGDPEMVFFAPIAAGAGIAASPAITSTMSGINTIGDAVAATTAGQRLTSGLNFVANAISKNKAWPWIDAGLTSAFSAHGIDKVRRGDIHNVGDVVETGLDLLPLAQLTKPIVNTVGRVGNAVETVTNRTLLNTVQRNALGEPIVPNELFKASPYEGYNYFHGGLEPDFDFNTLDVFRLGSKQGKRGKDYAGFYMHNNRDKLHAFGYGQGEAHGIKVSDDAKVLKLNQNVERMSQSELKQYRDQGYDMITGSNIWGEPEYILLNKDIIEDTKFFHEPPKNELRLFKAPRSVFGKKSKFPTIEWADAARTPQITAENAASITPEQWTAAQDAAIARGDMAEAQRLRDLHFKNSAPNTVTTEVFHHGNKKPMDWYTFDPARVGFTDEGYSGAGYYFAPTRPASQYAKEHFSYTLGPHGEQNAGLSGGKYHRYVYLNGETKYKPLREHDWTTHTDFPFVDNRPIEVVVGDNRQIKLADAVTYDNNGIRIPLGERDNFGKNDIRYSWLAPFIGLGTLGSLLNNNKKMNPTSHF